VSAALDADAHVDAGEASTAQQEDGLKDLEAQDLGLHQLQRDAVHLDQALAALAVGHSNRVFLGKWTTGVRTDHHPRVIRQRTVSVRTLRPKDCTASAMFEWTGGCAVPRVRS
jgi:hypothetical protein